MRCDEFVLRISELAGAGGGLESASDLAGHARECPACQLRLESLRQAEAILSASPLMAPPEGFAQRTMRAISVDRLLRTAPQEATRPSARIALMAAGGALLTVAIGAVIVGASVAWNPAILAGFAVQTLVVYLEEGLALVVSADAVLRAAGVIWGALPEPASAAFFCAGGLAALAPLAGWMWLVSRSHWAGRPVRP